MPPLLKLCRPHQWIKNGFVLVPLLFSKQFLNQDAIIQSFVALIVFCVASSAAYILNDILDIEKDRRHPTKSKSRPLASGNVSVKSALILLSLLYLILCISAIWSLYVFAVIAIYLTLNYLYSFFFKNIPVFDIFFISFGFVLRVYAGGIAISTGVSNWMFIVTLTLALYLASIKRRQELIKSGIDARSVLSRYTVELLTQYAEMAATCTVVFYSLFIALVRPELVLTIPLMLFGLYRYWFCVGIEKDGESPTDLLLSDRVLQGTLLLWVGLTACVLSGAFSI